MKQTSLFVDTSIFRGAGFNFESRTIDVLKEVAKRNHLRLLLPEITEKEVIRKISSLSKEIAESLDASNKKAFMLKHLKPWIFNEQTEIEEEINKRLIEDWKLFQKSFTTEKLPYSDIDLHKVLEWWEIYEPPFSKKKSSEFPDAFSATCLLKHQSLNNTQIAIISMDNDWKAFCDKNKYFDFYNSTLDFAESLNPDVKSILKIKSLIEKGSEVTKKIKYKVINSKFNITLGWDSTIKNRKVDYLTYQSLNVLNSSFDSAKIAFSCNVGLTMNIDYEDIFDGDRPLASPERFKTNYGSSVEVSGMISLKIDPENNNVSNVKITIDDDCDFSFPFKL